MSNGHVEQPVEQNKNLSVVPAFSLTIADKAGGVRFSFDPHSPEGAVRLIQATLKEVDKLEDMRDKEIKIVHWMSHPASTVDQQTSEVKEFTRIVIWDDKDKPYSCGSMGVDKSIALLEMTAGKAPWNPPLKVKVVVRRLANKNNWMILDPDIPSLQAILKPRK